jgi:hypothetical protein
MQNTLPMKALFGNRLARVAVLVGAMGVAYLVGMSRRGPSEGTTTVDVGGKNGGSAGTGQRQGMKMLSREEAKQQLLAILTRPGRGDAMDSLSKLLARINMADIPYVLDAVIKLPPGPDRGYMIMSGGTEQNFVLEDLFMKLNMTDPAKAFSLAQQIGDAHEKNAMLERALGMTADQKVAMAELLQLPANRETQNLYQIVFGGWAATNPAEAASAAAALPLGANRNMALQGVAKDWANKDPQAALDWAASLGSDGTGELKAALIATGQKDPNLAASYVNKLTDASARNSAISSIAQSMSQDNPAGALDWLDQTATGKTYDNSANKIMANLAQHDPATAATLMAKVTEPGVRDTAIANLAKNWGSKNPQAAVAWAQSLPDSDGAARNSALRVIVNTWSKYDSSAAAAFVQKAPDPTIYQLAAPAAATNNSGTSATP